MELKYVVLMIIKILISVPVVILFSSGQADAAALMGGHLDNNNGTNNVPVIATSYEEEESEKLVNNNNNNTDINNNNTATATVEHQQNSDDENDEEIPDPSALVLPGYNLPDNIFNKGKPFYLEKDPLTGQIDFDSKMSSLKLDDDMYDYVVNEPSPDLYDKSNINRKDGSLSGHHHRPSDVNQLTPNFHDFLNLPVKYNSDKYVYPLISSSYANTKIQGNVNKYQNNHKNYNVKTTTYKPTKGPSYYTTGNYFKPMTATNTIAPRTTTTTSTTTTTTTAKPFTDQTVKTTQVNLMNTEMNHPSFHEEFEYEDEMVDEPTSDEIPNDVYLTTSNIKNIYLTTKAPSVRSTTVKTTTKKTMNLFEQLFGDYDETVATTERTKPPKLFANLPTSTSTTTVVTTTTKASTSANALYPNAHAGSNVLSGSHMEISSSYEYEDEELNQTEPDNIAVPSNKPTVQVVNGHMQSPQHNEDVQLPEETSIYHLTSTTPVSIEHPLPNRNNGHQAIIVATANIREQLNNEKVHPKPFASIDNTVAHAPSTSNIHIAPDQDTVSFVVGNHQNVDDGQYVATSHQESPYGSNPFRPLYGQVQSTHHHQIPADSTSTSYQNQELNSAGSSITIQPEKHSEAELSIGVPLNSIKQVHQGQVVDEKIELDKIEFPSSPPKGTGGKVVFPDDHNFKDSTTPNFLPPPPSPTLHDTRNVLQLNSQPMYHQLPSDLTPPKEQPPPPLSVRKDRPWPPWDPRPGHFHTGKPEYVRPPRPPGDTGGAAYKRIDILPNILPQFRPNMQSNAPPHYFDNRFNRQPLLERPSNRPIGFFEKLMPPPPLKHLHHGNNLRKNPPPPPSSHNLRHAIAEDRIINEGPSSSNHDQFDFYQSPPPSVVLPNRRLSIIKNNNITSNNNEVETLQMIQAKQTDNNKKEGVILAESKVVNNKQDITSISSGIKKNGNNNNNTDKPLYVVYPVNTPPIKLDVIDSNSKESVVFGTRAELPLPPTKINAHFNYDDTPILTPKDRHDSPILKPHARPPPSSPAFPIKSDFPYALERPGGGGGNRLVPDVEVPEIPANNLDESSSSNSGSGDTSFIAMTNQWSATGGSADSSKSPPKSHHQISATLKTYTDRPIAVAYTPTTEYVSGDDSKYSMPNYANPVIPEIRPGTIDDVRGGGSSNEFTVGAVMHTYPQATVNNVVVRDRDHHQSYVGGAINHRIDDDVVSAPAQLDFQAPFQASVNVNSKTQGWSVVKTNKKNNNNKSAGDDASVTTPAPATTSEFDIENFKPQLIGGFKPIYDYPSEHSSNNNYNSKDTTTDLNETQHISIR